MGRSVSHPRAQLRRPLAHPWLDRATIAGLGQGAIAMGPWLLGVVPFGLVIGITIANSGISMLAGCATGLLIYSGSAQLVFIQLLDADAAVLVAVGTVVIMNARLALYGAAIAPHWSGTSGRFRVLAAYLLVDPSYVVGLDGYEGPTKAANRHAYYLGAGVVLWLAWQTAIVVGATFGAGMPPGLHLELVVPLFLVAELAVRVDGAATRLAATVAAVCAVAGTSLPLHSGLGLAIVAGIATAARCSTSREVET